MKTDKSWIEYRLLTKILAYWPALPLNFRRHFDVMCPLDRICRSKQISFSSIIYPYSDFFLLNFLVHLLMEGKNGVKFILSQWVWNHIQSFYYSG